MNQGIFIVLEGIDGSGTTTHCKLLSDWFVEIKNREVFLTQEPSNNIIGKMIRKLLKTPLPPATDALLFAADRVLHSIEIKEALDEKKIVICDRYIESSLCYQGVDLDRKWISIINKFVILPHLTIILDIDPEIGLKRKENPTDKFENIAFLTKVRQNFLKRAKNLKYPVIDTSKTIEAVQEEIRNCVNLNI